jgi:hypothetical protein
MCAALSRKKPYKRPFFTYIAIYRFLHGLRAAEGGVPKALRKGGKRLWQGCLIYKEGVPMD